MISSDIARLVVELAGRVGEREREKAEAEPEVCLVAVLTMMKSEVQEISATLEMTVRFSFFEDYLDEAREFLESQQTTTLEHREG